MGLLVLDQELKVGQEVQVEACLDKVFLLEFGQGLLVEDILQMFELRPRSTELRRTIVLRKGIPLTRIEGSSRPCSLLDASHG